MARFKARKWSNIDARPFDVVYITDDNHVYYQPNTTFSTEALAEVHANSLAASARIDSVLNLWVKETQS